LGIDVKHSTLRTKHQPTTQSLLIYYHVSGTFTGTRYLIRHGKFWQVLNKRSVSTVRGSDEGNFTIKESCFFIMFAYGQTAANAIAVMSYLAAAPSRRARSEQIAAARGISRALTAKLLTQLAASNFVSGQPGPNGGYTLAMNPSDISLLDIVSVFEQTAPPSVCAFGRGWCGRGTPCPLHDSTHNLIEINRRFLEETRFSVFFNAERKET